MCDIKAEVCRILRVKYLCMYQFMCSKISAYIRMHAAVYPGVCHDIEAVCHD